MIECFPPNTAKKTGDLHSLLRLIASCVAAESTEAAAAAAAAAAAVLACH